MARKKKAAEAENHERWLVSYADFITLLFAFFVVMFASSQADKGKAKQVSESVRKALEEGQVVAALTGILGGAVTAFAACLGEFGAIITFVSNIPGETRTIPLAIYTAIQTPGGEAAAARLAALSIALALAGPAFQWR